MDWDSAQHPGDVTENGVAMSNDVNRYRRETSLVCNLHIMVVILPLEFDAKYLTLIVYVKTLEDTGIFSIHAPCLCCVQKRGENQCPVCPDLDGQ